MFLNISKHLQKVSPYFEIITAKENAVCHDYLCIITYRLNSSVVIYHHQGKNVQRYKQQSNSLQPFKKKKKSSDGCYLRRVNLKTGVIHGKMAEKNLLNHVTRKMHITKICPRKELSPPCPQGNRGQQKRNRQS